MHAHLAFPEIEYGLFGLMALALCAIAFVMVLTFVRVSLRVIREQWRPRHRRARAHRDYPRGAAAPGRPRPADVKMARNSPAAATRVRQGP